MNQFKCLTNRLASIVILLLSPLAAQAETLDSGDTAWIMTSTALVLFMTIPGLSLFYAGLVRVLQHTVGDLPNVELRHGDAAKVDLGRDLGPGRWSMVSNLPYNVGTGIVLDTLTGVPAVERFVVMVQTEVAERLGARVVRVGHRRISCTRNSGAREARADWLVFVDAADGSLLWQNDCSANNTANCPDPAYADGRVFWANGYGKGGICLKLTKSSDGVTAKEVWRTKDMVSHHGGFITLELHW